MQKVQINDLSISYGNKQVVHGIDLNAKPGQFLTILGPSGCGKTSTLRAIAGLEEPDLGQIIIGDRVVFSKEKAVIVPPEQRNVGFIFQSYALWPHMTVEQNITLALKEKKFNLKEIQVRLRQALEMVQMEDYAARYPSELSGGQQQRVAVSRLIALKSGILLMDEPLSNLDSKLRIEMRAEIRRLHDELSATTVYVTHDQTEALTLSDKIIVMNEGRIVQNDNPYNIYHHPKNIFVAEFIGEPQMNFFKGQIAVNSSLTTFFCRDFQIPIYGKKELINKKLILAIRPENIELSMAERENWLHLLVKSIQPTGPNTIIQAQVGGSVFTILQPGFITLELNKSLWINFEPKDMHFFDIDTGLNIVSE